MTDPADPRMRAEVTVSQAAIREPSVHGHSLIRSAPERPVSTLPQAPGQRLLDRVREALRLHHYSRRTEKAYVHWIRRYILFHGKRHPAEMGADEVTRFLVRQGKGDKDRVTLLPAAVVPELSRHLEWVERQYRRDLEKGAVWVELPLALSRKYPNAGREWAWQWVFPATRTYVCRESGQRRRHHLHESVLQREVKEAVRRAGIPKPASCHSLRHSLCNAPP